MSGRCSHDEAVHRTGLIDRLAAFDPRVVGTLPLGVGVADSDIDVVCHAADLPVFAQAVWRHFAAAGGFALWQWTGAGRPVVARFEAFGWPFEIFGSVQPVDEQAGWRHFVVERRLLALGGERFRQAVMAQRRRGQKTEPAFAAVLGLAGPDPYAAMLALYGHSDSQLAALLDRMKVGRGDQVT